MENTNVLYSKQKTESHTVVQYGICFFFIWTAVDLITLGAAVNLYLLFQHICLPDPDLKNMFHPSKIFMHTVDKI